MATKKQEQIVQETKVEKEEPKQQKEPKAFVLTDKNYYSKQANLEYMSYSQFKDFCKCPAMAMAKINGEWQEETTDSLLVGSYVDAWLDGEIDKFKENHPEIFNTRTGELKANFKQAEDLCEIIKKDEYLYNLLKGKRQVVITGNIAGVKFKGKIDSLTEEYIVDGKVLKDCNEVWQDGGKRPFYMANRYDIQNVIYTVLYRQQTGEDKPYLLAVVTKEKTPDKRLVRINPNAYEDALQEIIAKAPVFDAIKKGEEPAWNCGECDYCKSIRQLNNESIEEI
jgi:hypothetical protein